MFAFFKKYAALKLTLLVLLTSIIFAGSVMTIKPKPAEAICCSSCCFCIVDTIIEDLIQWLQDYIQANIHFFIKLFLHRLLWWDFVFWQQKMLPMFMSAGNQLGAVGMHQIMIIGMFMDAKNQLETQRLIQQLHAEANRDYQPSIGMCEFGTRIKSLAATERKGELNAVLLSERSVDRLLNNTAVASSEGSKSDITTRLEAFKGKYCSAKDQNYNLILICPDSSSAVNRSAEQIDRYNKDIDFQRTLDSPWTVEFDITDGSDASADEEDIMALAQNLYGFEGFEIAPAAEMQNDGSVDSLQKAYMDMRAVAAKMQVAENSFNSLVALKGEGTDGSREFIRAYLKELGMPDGDIDAHIGENPSYHAQMEILTKKAYQSPLFYTNLYDKVANVERKGVAIQAIGLIQKFDTLKSNLRTEVALSILLELAVQQEQRTIQANIADQISKVP